jgi:hypothetical protein
MVAGVGSAGVGRGGDDGRGGADGRGGLVDGREAIGGEGVVGGGPGIGDRTRGRFPEDGGGGGRVLNSNGVCGRGRGVRTSGAGWTTDDGGPAASGNDDRARLYSRQHAGHRHSTTSDPSGFL